MRKDPIVEGVRKAGAELAASADFDLHKLFENLRAAETAGRTKKAALTKEAKTRKLRTHAAG